MTLQDGHYYIASQASSNSNLAGFGDAACLCDDDSDAGNDDDDVVSSFVNDASGIRSPSCVTATVLSFAPNEQPTNKTARNAAVGFIVIIYTKMRTKNYSIKKAPAYRGALIIKSPVFIITLSHYAFYPSVSR